MGAGWRLLGWLNYLIVYLAIHQLGFAWQTGRTGGPRRRLLWAAGGLTALIALENLGPYPVSMVSVQGEEISNSMPPNLTMLALGAAQTGLLLALEKPARRLLERGVLLGRQTVLINSVIMTVFLWHFTTLILVSALALLTGVGLSFFPGTDAWWLTRPLWIAVLVLALFPFVAAFTASSATGRPVAAPRRTPGLATSCSAAPSSASASSPSRYTASPPTAGRASTSWPWPCPSSALPSSASVRRARVNWGMKNPRGRIQRLERYTTLCKQE